MCIWYLSSNNWLFQTYKHSFDFVNKFVWIFVGWLFILFSFSLNFHHCAILLCGWKAMFQGICQWMFFRNNLYYVRGLIMKKGTKNLTYRHIILYYLYIKKRQTRGGGSKTKQQAVANTFKDGTASQEDFAHRVVGFEGCALLWVTSRWNHRFDCILLSVK